MEIIEIIDKSTVIVDYGYADGASIGDKLRIYKKGKPIVNTKGTVLGTVDLIKDTVEIVIAYEAFSICKKRKVTTREILNPLSAFVQTVVTPIPLKINDDTMTHREYVSSEPISVGDLVMKIPE
ncbi:hypothetical protein [Phascolarctobacterium faecium]|jgi:hypothetical protein|uniref:hypothetical protein n=1 Tax=Phascolarctobacterium faecium TaxID=33025 RepID=UPI00204FF954|nr:MAG TPA: Flagellar assembly protein T, C-terminal domain [Caudoviricetes sp.]